MPIMELDADRFLHLKGAPVVFGTKDWNVTRLEHTWWDYNEEAIVMMTTNTPDSIVVLIFEQYWVECLDRHVGQALR
jgi:hypothetical protein